MEYCSIQSAKIIDRPQYNFLKAPTNCPVETMLRLAR